MRDETLRPQADREHRYASALDLQIDLEDFAREARLPVSSARMSKFMRELFAEEIRANTQLLTVDRMDDQPTMPRPALTPEMLMGGAPGLPETPSDPSVELTPSEVHANQMQGTPGPIDTGYGVGSATDILLDEEVPKTKPAVVVLAVLAGALAVLGIAAAVYFFWLADPGNKKKEEVDRTPAVIVETPSAPEPKADEPPEVPVDLELLPPKRPGAQVLEGELVEGEPVAGESGMEPAADDAAEAPADDEEDPSESPEKDDNTGSTDDAKRKKRSTKRTTKGSSKSKSWDPDSPFPI